MKQFRLKNLLTAAAILTALASCNKDKITPIPVTPTAERAGVYVLNQGNFGSSNSSLTYYDYTTKVTTADRYNAVNGAGVGATANDLKVYGSKMYIAVDLSGVLNVVDSKTAKLIKQIPFKTATGDSREPRSIAFYKNNAFITLYDGNVAVMDTATLVVSKYIPVGRNPEQLVVSNNKLYVANSGGLDFGNPDKTVSVIDLITLTETKKVTVIANPISMGADDFGNVYVLSSGNYVDIAAGLTIINNVTDAPQAVPTLAGAYGTAIVTNGEFAYFLSADNKVLVYNVKTQTIMKENFITDGTVITTPYNLTYDPLTGEVFVTDAKNFSTNGELFAFDKTGKKEYSITTGINPAGIVFVNK